MLRANLKRQAAILRIYDDVLEDDVVVVLYQDGVRRAALNGGRPRRPGRGVCPAAPKPANDVHEAVIYTRTASPKNVSEILLVETIQ